MNLDDVATPRQLFCTCCPFQPNATTMRTTVGVIVDPCKIPENYAKSISAQRQTNGRRAGLKIRCVSHPQHCPRSFNSRGKLPPRNAPSSFRRRRSVWCPRNPVWCPRNPRRRRSVWCPRNPRRRRSVSCPRNPAIGPFSRQKGLPWCDGDLDQRHAARSDAAPSPRAFDPVWC